MLVYWIWLATRPGLHDRCKVALLEHFHDPEDIYFADPTDYSVAEGLSAKALESLKDKNLTAAEEVLSVCAKEKFHILTYRDEAYPVKLKNISDPPVVLYYKGKLPDFDNNPVIGIVGTRKASLYGVKVAKRMGYEIGKCGGIVVSGMAKGIDGAAMAGALAADQTVVGILGCGLDIVYPLCNRGLFADTEKFGCLISEFAPGTPPYGWNFLHRNRIISGLSNGVLVVEAPERSGALNTARQAGDQGRDVFVVPANIDVPTCVGSNALLRDGATSVTCGYDVVSEYESLYPGKIRKDNGAIEVPELTETELKVAQAPVVPKNKRPVRRKNDKKAIDKEELPPYSDGKDKRPHLTALEQSIVDCLAAGERLADDIIAQLGLPTGQVLATLTMLEVKGVVKSLPGKRVALK